MDAKVLGFEMIIPLYKSDPDFSDSYKNHGKGSHAFFYIHQGYVFKDKRLCVPQCSLQEFIVREAHRGGVMGHFGVVKTLAMLKKHFFWPHLRNQ